jgi:hypothetical protein
MGLRCTVFGHKWGEVDVDRDREEEGDEVVVSVREVRTCRRCGTEDVLGKSKEVTAIEPPGTGSAGAESTGTDRDQRGEERPPDPQTDDGVILDEDDAPRDRGPREWPGRPEREGVEERDADPAPWPAAARASEADPADEACGGADEVPGEQRQRGGDHGEGPPRDDTRGEQPARHTGDDREPMDRDVPAPDDDGIIEAGGGTVDEDGRDGANDGVDVPRAGEGPAQGEEPAPRKDTTHEEAAAQDEDPAHGEDPTLTEGSGPTEDSGRGDPQRRGESDWSREPTDTPAMGADGTSHPDDDAEVLEDTEPNEQSRVTAEEPVDPADAGSGPSGEPVDPTAGGPGEPAGESDGTTEPSLDPSEPTDDEEPAPEDVEYYCPQCGYVDDSRWPSRRAGDICPDCQRSYLAERKT